MPRQGWHPDAAKGGPPDRRLFTLDVFLISGQMTEAFVKANPVVCRTIQIRGDQTLEDFHHAIFRAFSRWDGHMYEFQFGKGPHDPKGTRYVIRGAAERSSSSGPKVAGVVGRTTIGSLGLTVGQPFGYWFDFGDDWWHQINVAAITSGYDVQNDIWLRNYDIVYVPKTRLQSLSEFVLTINDIILPPVDILLRGWQIQILQQQLEFIQARN